MREICEGVYFIPGQDEFMPDAHVYLLGKPVSGNLTLVDAGLAGKEDYKIKAISELGVELSSVKRVIMTHTHFDHIGCLPGLLNALPDAEVWMHAYEADPLEQGDERTVYGMEMFKDICQSQFGIRPGTFGLEVKHKLQGGEKLDLGGMTWQVLHIPGHSRGSIGLYSGDEKILIPGDVIYADYAIGRFDLHGASGPELRDSLLALSKLEVSTLLPGHNRVAQGLGQGYISETLKQWEPFLS